MGIEKLDKNFAVVNDGADGEKAIYTIPHESFDLYGVFYAHEEKAFRRMPKEIADKVSPQVAMLSLNTSGGRLRFKTNSKTIGLEVTLKERNLFLHMPDTSVSGFMLLEKTKNSFKFVNGFKVERDKNVFCQSIKVNGEEMTEYILYFPLYSGVESLKVILDVDAVVTNGEKYRDIKPILYYGSSITQGGCATRSDGSYQALISKWNDIDFINLGFSGGCHAQDIMVDYLITLDTSLFVLDYDHNAPNVNYLKRTHYKLYKRYREAHPDMPILILSKPDFERFPHNLARYKVIRKTYLQALKEGDTNVYFIAGKELFGKFDRENCTVDGTHPNDLGFYRMAKKIYNKMIKIKEIFK